MAAVAASSKPPSTAEQLRKLSPGELRDLAERHEVETDGQPRLVIIDLLLPFYCTPPPAHGLCFVNGNIVGQLNKKDFVNTTALCNKIKPAHMTAVVGKVYFRWWNQASMIATALYKNEAAANEFYSSVDGDEHMSSPEIAVNMVPITEKERLTGCESLTFAEVELKDGSELFKTVRDWIVGADETGIGKEWSRPEGFENVVPVFRLEPVPLPQLGLVAKSPVLKMPVAAGANMTESPPPGLRIEGLTMDQASEDSGAGGAGGAGAASQGGESSTSASGSDDEDAFMAAQNALLGHSRRSFLKF